MAVFKEPIESEFVPAAWPVGAGVHDVRREGDDLVFAFEGNKRCGTDFVRIVGRYIAIEDNRPRQAEATYLEPQGNRLCGSEAFAYGGVDFNDGRLPVPPGVAVMIYAEHRGWWAPSVPSFLGMVTPAQNE